MDENEKVDQKMNENATEKVDQQKDKKATEKIDEKVQKLITAVSDGNFDKVRALLNDKDIDLEQGDENGLTPLLMASFKGHYEIVKFLIELGADVNYSKHYHKYSALMFAAIGGHKKIVNLLLESGADVNHTNSINRTASQMAGFVAQTDIVVMIKNFLPKSTIDYYTQPKGNDPKLSKHLVKPLHKFVLTVNVHPVYILLNLENYVDLIKNIDQVKEVLQSISDKEMIDREIPAENIAFKLAYLVYLLNYFEKQFKLIQIKHTDLETKEQIRKTVDLIIKLLLKERTSTGFPVALEKFIRTACSSFKYKDSSVFILILQKLHNVKIGDEPSALQLLIDSINDQKGFFNNCVNCQTCNELNPTSKCSSCKSVWYCNQRCQKYDWPGHKLICKKT